MKDRDCENCANHTSLGCKSWECEFKQKEVLPNMDELLERAYQQGRADAIAEIEKSMHEAYKGTSNQWECMVFDLVMEQMKEANK